MERSAKGSDATGDEHDGVSALSGEQRRLLVLLGEGLSVAKAAEVMHISRRTAVRRLAHARRLLAAPSTLNAVSQVAVAQPSRTPPQQRLSPRERQALELVGSGMTSAAAAERLSVQPSTVDSLVKSAMAKLDGRTRAEAVARLAQFGEET